MVDSSVLEDVTLDILIIVCFDSQVLQDNYSGGWLDKTLCDLALKIQGKNYYTLSIFLHDAGKLEDVYLVRLMFVDKNNKDMEFSPPPGQKLGYSENFDQYQKFWNYY